MKFPLVGQAYVARSKAVSDQDCVNLFLESTESGGRSRIALYGTPGLTSFVTPGTGPIRGLHVMNNLMYVVSGKGLYSVTIFGGITSLGTIAGTDRVSMQSSNETAAAEDALLQQLVIVNGNEGYTYDTTNGLVQITDADFYPANVVANLDTYFLFNRKGSHMFFMSNSNDGSTFGALDFGEKVTFSDNLVSLLTDHKELWLFGETSIEVWYNAGAGAGLPFAQIESAFIERGCAAVHSPEKIDNTVFWLGEDLVIYRAEGYNAKRISTHAIEFAIKQYTTVSDAFSFTYTDEGHKFYVLTFPSGSTWVYDVSTNAWHERRSFGLDRWRANCYVFFNNKHYIGDYSTNDVHEMDLDVYSENGTTIERIRSVVYLHAESNPLYMDWLQVIFESGVGLTTGQGSDPQAMLTYSDDSGMTWSSEKWASIGKIGEYLARVRWTQLGRFYQRIFRLKITDPVKVVIVEANTSLDSNEI